MQRGDPRAAEQLLPLVYDELRKLAAQRLAHETTRPDPPGHGPGPRGVPATGRRRAEHGTGTAAAISSPPRPRRCGGSWSTTPARKRRRSTAATRPQRIDLERTRPPTMPRPTTCSPWTRPRPGWPPRTRAGRAGQAPLLRRALARGGCRGPRRRRQRPPTADWAFARAWLCQRARSAGAAEILSCFETQTEHGFARGPSSHCAGRCLDARGDGVHGVSCTRSKTIFCEALERTAGAERPPYLDRRLPG